MAPISCSRPIGPGPGPLSGRGIRHGECRAAGAAVPASRVVLLGAAGAGATYPAVSPDGSWLALSTLRGDGYHIAVTPFRPGRNFPLGSRLGSPTPCPSRRWSATRSGRRRTQHGPVLFPAIGRQLATDPTRDFCSRDLHLGLQCAAASLVRVEALYNFRQPNQPEFYGAYEYRGLGVPVIDLGGTMYWTHERVADAGGVTVGEARALVGRDQFGGDDPVAYRAHECGVDRRWRMGISRLPDRPTATHRRPRAVLFVSELPVDVHEPHLDQCTVSGSRDLSGERAVAHRSGERRLGARRHQRHAAQRIGVANAYQALNWPGFAHHVIALQVAGAGDTECDLDVHGGRRRQTRRFRSSADCRSATRRTCSPYAGIRSGRPVARRRFPDRWRSGTAVGSGARLAPSPTLSGPDLDLALHRRGGGVVSSARYLRDQRVQRTGR